MNQKTITLKFADDLQDQALLKAICQTSEFEIRTPLTRQVKHLLSMALGLSEVDEPMQLRLFDRRLTVLEAQVRKAPPKPDLKLVD